MKPACSSGGWESPRCLDESSEVSVGETGKDEPAEDTESEPRGWEKKKKDDSRWNYSSKRFPTFPTVAIEDITMIT